MGELENCPWQARPVQMTPFFPGPTGTQEVKIHGESKALAVQFSQDGRWSKIERRGIVMAWLERAGRKRGPLLLGPGLLKLLRRQEDQIVH